MPTIHQLIKRKRKSVEKKDKAPALAFGFNPLKTNLRNMNLLLKKGFA